MTILVDLQEVTLEGADRTLLESLSLTISSGDRIGVVGINGVGKTTLLRIIAGTLSPDSGDIRRGRDVRVGFLEQIPVLPNGTVRETLGTGWKVDAALDRLGMLGARGVDTKNLSGGELKRVALARVFGNDLDVLILDEPTNHLDLDAIQWLEQRDHRLSGRGGPSEPRPLPPRSGHDAHGRDRPRQDLRPRGWLLQAPRGPGRT